MSTSTRIDIKETLEEQVEVLNQTETDFSVRHSRIGSMKTTQLLITKSYVKFSDDSTVITFDENGNLL